MFEISCCMFEHYSGLNLDPLQILEVWQKWLISSEWVQLMQWDETYRTQHLGMNNDNNIGNIKSNIGNINNDLNSMNNMN